MMHRKLQGQLLRQLWGKPKEKLQQKHWGEMKAGQGPLECPTCASISVLCLLLFSSKSCMRYIPLARFEIQPRLVSIRSALMPQDHKHGDYQTLSSPSSEGQPNWGRSSLRPARNSTRAPCCSIWNCSGVHESRKTCV